MDFLIVMLRRLILLASTASAAYSVTALLSFRFDPLTWDPGWQAAFLAITLGAAMLIDALIGADHDDEDVPA
jgi:hypothetical protein